MKLAENFRAGGKGVIATASGKGVVNTAVYAAPHVIGDGMVAWGMTEGRTHLNVKENPCAEYLYFGPGDRMNGVRLTLALKEISTSGGLLEEIRDQARKAVSKAAGDAVKYVAYFKVLEVRPLY